MSKYAIIDLEILEKRIEELKDKIKNDGLFPQEIEHYKGQIHAYRQILSKSTLLVPVLEKAIEFGKDIRTEKSYISEDFGTFFIEYEDSTKETNDYISNLKLDV